MKKSLSLLLLLSSLFVYGNANQKNKADTIKVSYHKTAILIFEENILFAEAGNLDLAAEFSGKILKCTAAIPNIHETNLFVETESGYYSFVVQYQDNPTSIPKYIKKSDATIEKIQQQIPSNIVVEKEKQQEAQTVADTEQQQVYLKDCEKIVTSQNGITDVGVIGTKVTFMLGDIYINKDMLYFKLIVKNTSNIPYDIELFRLAIRSKKGAIKQAAVQETVLEPTYIYNDDVTQIKGKDGVVKIFVIKKFTISDDKRLFIELWENGGERILSFAVSSDQILNVKTIY